MYLKTNALNLLEHFFFDSEHLELIRLKNFLILLSLCGLRDSRTVAAYLRAKLTTQSASSSVAPNSEKPLLVIQEIARAVSVSSMLSKRSQRFFCKAEKVSTLTSIPQAVATFSIYKYAFYQNYNIKSITTSNGVTGIGDYAF